MRDRVFLNAPTECAKICKILRILSIKSTISMCVININEMQENVQKILRILPIKLSIICANICVFPQLKFVSEMRQKMQKILQMLPIKLAISNFK